MKISQARKHHIARVLLTTAVVGRLARWRMTRVHVQVFLDLSPPAERDARHDHLRAFFDASMDAYLTALREGYTEGQAREIVHVQANLDFYRYGWTELMGLTAEELDPHYERYEGFFERHGVDFDDPLGEFAPAGGLPDAPETPERRDAPVYQRAQSGYADDLYVDAPDLDVRASREA